MAKNNTDKPRKKAVQGKKRKDKGQALILQETPVRASYGHYRVLQRYKEHLVKEVVVLPRQIIPMQRHTVRDLQITIISGEGLALTAMPNNRGEMLFWNLMLSKNTASIISGQWHEITNVTDHDLIMIVIEIGAMTDDLEFAPNGSLDSIRETTRLQYEAWNK